MMGHHLTGVKLRRRYVFKVTSVLFLSQRYEATAVQTYMGVTRSKKTRVKHD